MKLVKCKKCGSTIMTAETLLSDMQSEYNELSRMRLKAKGDKKQLLAQEMKHLSKMMTAVIHSATQMEERKDIIYNQFYLLKDYVIDNKLMTYEQIDQIEAWARETAKRKFAEDDKKIKDLYGDYENYMANKTKADPTAAKALRETRNFTL